MVMLYMRSKPETGSKGNVNCPTQAKRRLEWATRVRY
jgi:hypothetical protein